MKNSIILNKVQSIVIKTGFGLYRAGTSKGFGFKGDVAEVHGALEVTAQRSNITGILDQFMLMDLGIEITDEVPFDKEYLDNKFFMSIPKPRDIDEDILKEFIRIDSYQWMSTLYWFGESYARAIDNKPFGETLNFLEWYNIVEAEHNRSEDFRIVFTDAKQRQQELGLQEHNKSGLKVGTGSSRPLAEVNLSERDNEAIEKYMIRKDEVKDTWPLISGMFDTDKLQTLYEEQKLSHLALIERQEEEKRLILEEGKARAVLRIRTATEEIAPKRRSRVA